MISQKQFKELFEYYNQFELEDPPTTVWTDETKDWKNSAGQIHRNNDRPAWIGSNDSMSWQKCGTWHREVGPAWIWSNGECEYCINHIPINSNDWFKRIMEL